MAAETELFIRYEGTNEAGKEVFTVLSGIEYHYNRPGTATETEEALYFTAEAAIMSYIVHPGDAVYIVGDFTIDESGNVTITTLSTVFYYEFFLWRFMYARAEKLKGTDL